MSVNDNLARSMLWFAAAHQDQRAVNALLREDIYAGACFHAQQCVEKAMKGILVACDVPIPKSHSIRDLVDKLPPFPDGSPGDTHELLRKSAKLDRLYLPTRYPDAAISQKPIDETFDAEDAINAKTVADRSYAVLADWAIQLNVPIIVSSVDDEQNSILPADDYPSA